MKNRRLILHLGTFKTGTTYLQRAFHASRHALAEQNVVYPGFASNHGMALYPLLSGNQHGIARHPYGGIWLGLGAQREIDRVQKEYQLVLNDIQDNSLTILSGEHFTTLNAKSAFKFVQQLREYFTDILGVLTLRAPLSFSTSMTQQLIRDGVPLADATRNPIRPQFQSTINPWEMALGQEALKINIYNPEENPVDVFLNTIGRNDILPYIRKDTIQSRTNSALSAEALAIIDQINIAYPGGLTNPHRGIRIAELAARIKGARFSFDSATQQQFYLDCKEDIDWLYQRFGLNFFPKELPEKTAAAKVYPPERLERLAMRLNQLCLKRQNREAERLINLALDENNEDKAWEGIAIMTNLDKAMKYKHDFSALNWQKLANYTSSHIQRLTEKKPMTLNTITQQGRTSA